MSAARKALQSIYMDLSRGYTEMALLGTSSERELQLDSPENLARFTDTMRVNIAAALNKDRTTTWLIYVLLALLFAVAIALTICAATKGSPWNAAATIPGLGVTTAWPIKRLIDLRNDRLKLILMPELLPLLKLEDAQRIAARFLGLT